MRKIKKGAHIRICESKRRREPVAVLVPYDWYVLAIGFQVSPGGDGEQFFRFSREFYDFVRTGRAAVKITPEEPREYLHCYDLADPGGLQEGDADHGAGHEQE